jgi:hypothetical protein
MQFAYRIDLWDADGNSVVKHLADIDDLIIAGATYETVCKRWPGEHQVTSGRPHHRRQPPEYGCMTQGRPRIRRARPA